MSGRQRNVLPPSAKVNNPLRALLTLAQHVTRVNIKLTGSPLLFSSTPQDTYSETTSTQQEKMPSVNKAKRVNVSKNAAAQHQCAKAIERAANGDAGTRFYSVQKALGNAFFLLRDEDGNDFRGTPRGLFTKGTMLVAMGQIVVAEGDAKGLEIVGVIQKRSDAVALVKSGALSANILSNAVAAGAMTVAVDEEDDLFETLADEESAIGDSKADRSKAEAMRSVAALASRLGSKVRPASQVMRPPTAPASAKVTEMDGLWDNSRAASTLHATPAWEEETEVDIDAI